MSQIDDKDLKKDYPDNAGVKDDSLVAVIADVAEAIRLGVRKYNAEKDSAEAKQLCQLTITQLHYLHLIEARKGITGTELSKEFNVAKPTVTNVVGRLVDHGYVRKKMSAKDRRVYFLYLTEKGKHLLAVERQGYYNYAEKVVNELTDEEAQQLCLLFSKLR
ncbi:MAG: MarR family transcriptional regulator [Selenomonadaceae bacterium]|nr:MarR family transcriptional regulator [Selenomonadaceae bacterium]